MAHEISCGGQTGLALTARLMQGASQVGSAITMTEAPGVPGHYTGNLPATAAGAYTVQFLNGGAVVASALLRWDGTAVVRPALPSDVPTASTVASAVWAAGSRTLTSLGTLVADTVAAVWAAATRTLTADPGAAAHATTLAAVAAVPAAVRSNLTTELGRIDVAVSTRESEASAATRATTNQTEHDATQTAIAAVPAAVRSNLATELARLDVAVSTRESEASAATRATTNQAEHDATQATLASGTLQVDLRKVNGIAVDGSGTPADPWGPV